MAYRLRRRAATADRLLISLLVRRGWHEAPDYQDLIPLREAAWDQIITVYSEQS